MNPTVHYYYLDIPRADERSRAFEREQSRFDREIPFDVARGRQGDDDVAFAHVCHKIGVSLLITFNSK